MNPAVSIKHINKNFGSLKALDDVNFEIGQGRLYGLLGPNGAGKSTLINIMAGLTRPDMGTIDVLGNDVQRKWRKTRRDIGVVPQELAYDWFFSTREMLRLQSGYFGLDTSNYEWIEYLIERLDITDKADDVMHVLSGGMKRRALIAQALVHKPEVVVLDEPTAGVDVELRRVLYEFIKELHKKGHTILLTTHYLEEAESLCERIAILDKGRLIADDTTSSLVKQYPFRFLHITLYNSDIKIADALIEKVVSSDKKEYVFKLHREKDRISEVLDSLSSSGIVIKDLRTEEPGLEEVFINLTGKKQ